MLDVVTVPLYRGSLKEEAIKIARGGLRPRGALAPTGEGITAQAKQHRCGERSARVDSPFWGFTTDREYALGWAQSYAGSSSLGQGVLITLKPMRGRFFASQKHLGGNENEYLLVEAILPDMVEEVTLVNAAGKVFYSGPLHGMPP